jgi:pyruvate, water dikinase
LTKLLAWFGEVDKDDLQTAGGKGANLGELTRAGIPVPPGFIVTTDSYLRFLDEAGLPPKITALLSGLDTADRAELRRVSGEIKQMLCSAAVPADIAAAVVDAYREMGEGLVAVRSSATAEDLADASFAGQQSTYLNVAGPDAVVHAVRECWASLFEPQAVHYRVGAGFGATEAAIGVVIQRMVQSERSGVMFTVDPVSGARDRIIIEAVLGLGEATVSGLVTPDMYVVDKESLDILAREVSAQERQLVRNADATPGAENNVWLDIRPAEGAQQKLSDEQIREMAEIGRRVEGHYGAPQDIEWALEGGDFCVVQSRPVTRAGIG